MFSVQVEIDGGSIDEFLRTYRRIATKRRKYCANRGIQAWTKVNARVGSVCSKPDYRGASVVTVGQFFVRTWRPYKFLIIAWQSLESRINITPILRWPGRSTNCAPCSSQYCSRNELAASSSNFYEAVDDLSRLKSPIVWVKKTLPLAFQRMLVLDFCQPDRTIKQYLTYADQRLVLTLRFGMIPSADIPPTVDML